MAQRPKPRLAAPAAVPVTMRPCRITSTSPLMVDLGNGTPIPGVAIAGLDYSTGAAIALLNNPGQPVILKIG